MLCKRQCSFLYTDADANANADADAEFSKWPVKFLLKPLTLNKSILKQKRKYLNSIRLFPFFISFYYWDEINQKSSIKEDTRKMKNCKADNIPEKRFFYKIYWK